jgi:hypothetical protein
LNPELITYKYNEEKYLNNHSDIVGYSHKRDDSGGRVIKYAISTFSRAENDVFCSRIFCFLAEKTLFSTAENIVFPM